MSKKSLMVTSMTENIPCSKGAKFTSSLSLSKHQQISIERAMRQ
jgi:hypothetical protein